MSARRIHISIVMAGLVPATHPHRRGSYSWMAGTRPATTGEISPRFRARCAKSFNSIAHGELQRPGLWGNGGGPHPPLFCKRMRRGGRGADSPKTSRCGPPWNTHQMLESMRRLEGTPLPNSQRFEWELFESAGRTRGLEIDTAGHGGSREMPRYWEISCRKSGDYPICCAGSRGSRPRHRCTSR